MATLVTTNQAAARLGITSRRVRALVASGKLPAVRIGRDWLINEADLAAITIRKIGYPKGRPRH